MRILLFLTNEDLVCISLGLHLRCFIKNFFSGKNLSQDISVKINKMLHQNRQNKCCACCLGAGQHC